MNSRPRTAYFAVTLLCLTAWLCAALQAGAQLHPAEIRVVYPLCAAPGTTTRVTISGMSLRDVQQALVDRHGLSIKILPTDTSKLSAPTLDSDGNPDVAAEFTIMKEAEPGVYTFRLVSPTGLSNLGKFVVGRELPTLEAKEPNDRLEQAQTVPLPIAIDGRLHEIGDRDNFAVTLEAGKTFVAEVTASAADSPLDSRLVLRDANGREIASNDNFGGPDALLVFSVPKSGRYVLTLSSSVGSGDPNQVYHLSLGYLPLLTAVYPASMERGKPISLLPVGINLPDSKPLEWQPKADATDSSQPFCLPTPVGPSNPKWLLLSGLPTITPKEPGRDRLHATPIPVPGIANGRFYRADSKPGSVTDFYKFHAEAKKRYVLEAQCAALGSRADPVLTLFDDAGKPLEENDDSDGKPDSRIERAFDQAGDYTLQVKERKGFRGPDYVYRLVVQEAPSPGFTLTTETRARVVGRGDSVPFEVEVTRDRWDGPVTLSLADLPQGVTASACQVPEGVGRGLLILTAAKDAPLGAFPLHIVGTAQINGQTSQRTLDRASDWVWKGGDRTTSSLPANTIQFAVVNPFEIAPMTDAKALTVPRGQGVKFKVRVERRVAYEKPIKLRVMGLPDGVTAEEASLPPDKQEIELEIKANAEARLGAFPIAVTAIATHSEAVQLDRVTPSIALTVAEAPKP